MAERRPTKPNTDTVYDGLASRAHHFDTSNDLGSLHSRLKAPTTPRCRKHKLNESGYRSWGTKIQDAPVKKAVTTESAKCSKKATKSFYDRTLGKRIHCSRPIERSAIESHAQSALTKNPIWVEALKNAGTIGLGGFLSALSGSPAPLAVAATNVGSKVIDRSLSLS